MADDLRSRYAAALAATCPVHELFDACERCDARIAAVLAVRDEEMANLRAEVARLRAGESTEPAAPHTDMTPAQWIHRWNRAAAEERIAVVEQLRRAESAADRCFVQDHPGQIEYHRTDAELARQKAAAILDQLADLRGAWKTRRREHEIRRETADGAALVSSVAAEIYTQTIRELDATLVGHGPAQTTREQLAAVEDRAQRDAETAAARITHLEQQLTELGGAP